MSKDETTPVAGTGTKETMTGLRDSWGLLIDWGKFFAVKLAMKKLTTHSREVREEMVKEGIIPENNERREFWLGTIFHELQKEKVLEKTGLMHKYSDETRGIHERTIALWRLVEDGDLTKYRVAPEIRP